ncbi:hypothetical protein DPEC_G00121120 [Dallia pectoralis]|uniref:Uncharacterized protein n=1 Tax=Dallia pectoralis TaxID=75939 RepID=A0ACC2GQ43_DALPE|nr:hypothetical protein DPEC_G00121120 [Dallia pectoralis]
MKWWCQDYLGSIDDGLKARPTQAIHSEGRHRDGNPTPQAYVAGDIRRVCGALETGMAKRGRDKVSSRLSFLLPLCPWTRRCSRPTCMTFPNMTLLMSSGATPPAASAALEACSARSVALWSFSTPP